jgi:hypothetical protein
VFNAVAAVQEVPPGFLMGVVTPIFKAGDHTQPANYRPITVLNTDYRILAKAAPATGLTACTFCSCTCVCTLSWPQASFELPWQPCFS